MLVLSRKVGEAIQIGDDVQVMVVRIGPGVVRIGIAAPKQMAVVRQEIDSATPQLPTSGNHDHFDTDEFADTDWLKSR